MDCMLKRVLKRVLKDNIKYYIGNISSYIENVKKCIGNVKRCIGIVKRCIGNVKSVLKIIITFLENTNGPKRVLKHKPKHKPYRAKGSYLKNTIYNKRTVEE